MDELLELITGNISIIVALAIGFFGFLTSRFNKQDEQEQPTTQSGQPATVSPDGDRQVSSQQIRPAAKNVNQADGSSKAESSASQKQSQREALAKRMNVDPDDLEKAEESAHEVKNERLRPDTEKANKQQHQVKSQFKKQLTKNNLINGFVMSEILGRPRAHKPYKSVVEDRIKDK